MAVASRVWSGEQTIAVGLDGDDLADVLKYHGNATAWWVISRHDIDRLRGVAAALELDMHAIADLSADDGRAKFEQLGQVCLVVMNVVAFDPEATELTVGAASCVVTDRAIICCADAGSARTGRDFVVNAWSRSEQQLSKGGTTVALQALISAVIASYEKVVNLLEDAGDQLADSLFEGRPLTKEGQVRAFHVRSATSGLRRQTEPMRTVLRDLAEVMDGDGQAQRMWTMIVEREDRVANAADALADSLTSMFETSLALADLRMNEIMKKLSGWAAIIAVPTLVTGFIGMNVGFPLKDTVAGFYAALVLIIFPSIALYLLFKRIDWL